ncbi:hypothetical protein K1719_037439 [Acacia pycnantha]|nr:hypothetical protein K1719_037439 [Acacia pycnantha]
MLMSYGGVNKGPWVINHAYLNVARWRPEFNPKSAIIESVVAWVRFPDLLAPLFDKKFLLNLGNVIGKAIKLDIHIAQQARGKFARMFGHSSVVCEDLQKRNMEERMEVENLGNKKDATDNNNTMRDLWKTMQRPRRPRRVSVPA